jgi:ABC-type multidrug transport system fused ATPase/permease subunit
MQNTANSDSKMNVWNRFKVNHPKIAQFIVFFIISNGVTVLQMILMPLIKYLFNNTSFIDINFQIMSIGHNLDGSTYYVFDYAAGNIAKGGGGGLAYFLAVEITLLIAQVINFFMQRNVTFKSSKNIAKAATWYFIAWIIISVGAAALQGLYKTPIYDFSMELMGEKLGMTIADILTMLINCTISFWVFFPILQFIFKEKETKYNL